MTEEKKKQLFPYFAYLYSQELNPEKYGAANSIEEWTDLIQNSPEDINEISAAASELTDEDWDQIEQQYAQAQTEGSETATAEEIQSAKKGAKLKKLQEFKTGGKSKKKKKCACGCEMISKKEFGGTIVDTCTCCGEIHKHQEGGIMKFQNPSGGIREIKPGYYQGYHPETNFKTAVSRNRALVERSLSDYVNNPNIKRALARAKREARPSTGNFNATPKTPGTQPAGGAPQKVTTQNNKLPSTSGAVRTPLENNAKRVPAQSDRLISIVDYLNAEGMNSSFGNRRQLAAKLGIQNYIGSSDQNKHMIELLQAQRQQDLAQAKIATPSLAPAPVTATLPPITPILTTMLASRKKGGNIKKVQKGGEATNPALKGMKPAQVDSVQAYNRSAPVTNFDKKAKFDPTSDQRDAKKILNDLRTGKSKLDPEESKRLKAKLAKTKK